MILKNVEKKDDSTVAFQVECDNAEFEAAIASAYKKNKGQIYIPGFRKGKAPRTVIEGMYGPEVFYQDAFDILAPDAFEFGTKEAELKVVGAPAISDINVTEEKAVELSFTADVYPEVTLGEYKGLEATVPPVVVSDEDVEKELQSVRERNGRKISVDREAQMGDTANIDYEGFLEGVPFDGGKDNGYFLELGSNSFVPGFEEQIVGMKAGEEKDIDITFPEDYAENLAGKAVVFHIKLNGLTYTELPELDDEFAKDVSEFDTLEEYKADLLETLKKRYEDANESAVKGQLIQKAVDGMTVVLPKSMINAKAEDIVRNYAANYGISDPNMSFADLCKLMGLEENVMLESVRPSAEYQVKVDLLLEKIAEAEAFEITEEEVNAYVERISGNMGVTAEQLKSYFGDEFIKDQQKKEKAEEIIRSSAVVTIKEAEEETAEEPAKEAEPAEE